MFYCNVLIVTKNRLSNPEISAIKAGADRLYRRWCRSGLPEGIHIFKPKIPIWVNFGGPWNGKCRYILRPFGTFYGPLVYVLCGHVV
jgi:hypothetical protein